MLSEMHADSVDPGNSLLHIVDLWEQSNMSDIRHMTGGAREEPRPVVPPAHAEAELRELGCDH